MISRIARLIPVVTAQSAADRARLAACLARIRGHRAAAASWEAEARTVTHGTDGADMLAKAQWRDHARARARDATAAANALEPEAAALARRLSRSVGREQAVAALADAERREVRACAARRAEDAAPRPRGDGQSSASTAPGAGSSVGTA